MQPSPVIPAITYHVEQAFHKAEMRVKMLLASKTDRKAIGHSAGDVRDAMRAGIAADAVKLAIAEDVLRNPTLYGDRMYQVYIDRCLQVFEPEQNNAQ